MFVYLVNVLNAARVKDTDSYSVTLYAVDGSNTYNIAQTSTGIIVPSSMLTTGTITSFVLTPADTTVSATTLYTLTI